MNREQLLEHWKEIKAFKNGAEIECKTIYGQWLVVEEPKFFIKMTYRVKPEPHECWIKSLEGEYVVIVDPFGFDEKWSKETNRPLPMAISLACAKAIGWKE